MLFFLKCLYHNNLAEQVGEDNSDTVANLCTKVIYEMPGQLASVFHIWQQKRAPSLSVSLKTVKSAVKELAVRGKFYFFQANHSVILKADLVDSSLDWQPKVVRQACNPDCLTTVWVSLSETDEEVVWVGKYVYVCVYERRNTDSKCSCFSVYVFSLW